jgi:hypothetical protein
VFSQSGSEIYTPSGVFLIHTGSSLLKVFVSLVLSLQPGFMQTG